MGVRDVGADDFPKGAGAEDLFHVDGELFYGVHESGIIFVAQLVDFVDFSFWYDEGVAWGLGINIEEGHGLFVFVNLVTRNFAVDDFGKNTTHF